MNLSTTVIEQEDDDEPLDQPEESDETVSHIRTPQPQYQIPSSRPNYLLIRLIRKCYIIPQRWVLGIMGLLGVCNAYTMRVCLNIAIIQMVTTTPTHKKGDPNYCPGEVLEPNVTRIKKYAIFDWSEALQGLLLSSFYYGYAMTQVVGAILSERYGAKWPLGVGMLITALFTIATPWVVRTGGAYALFILRVLKGMGGGPIMPCLMVMLSRWTPPHERGFQGALVFGGAQVGNIFGNFVSGHLMANDKDWAYVFYVFGVFAIIWFILWSVLCFSTPHSHPFITDKELRYLDATIKVQNVKDKALWKAIVSSTSALALVFAAIGHDWGYYTMVTDLPKYAHDVLKFNIKTTGHLISLPYAAMWISSLIAGYACDQGVKRGWHSVKTGRIIYTTIDDIEIRRHYFCVFALAATGPAICIISASYVGCSRNSAMALFVLSMALMGPYYAGMKVNALDLAPNYVASLTSVVNTTATFSGIIAPYVMGLMTPDSTLSQWRSAFWVCFGVLVGTNIIYDIWAEGEQQWWDDVEKFGYPPNWKHDSILPYLPVPRRYAKRKLRKMRQLNAAR